jgi:hypothetical protein
MSGKRSRSEKECPLEVRSSRCFSRIPGKTGNRLRILGDCDVPSNEKPAIERHIQACKRCVEDPRFLAGVMNIIERMNMKA